MTTTPSFVRRRQIPIFFTLAFALSWLVWGSAIAQRHGLLTFHIPGNLAFFAVSLAAFIVAGCVGGRPAMGDLVRRMLRVRVAPRWYAAALLVPVALPVIAVGLYRLLGGAAFAFDLSLGAVAGYVLFHIPFFLITEETAWRGFALPRLQAGRGALSASLLLGVLWGVWHTPLFLMPDEIQSTLPFVGFVLFAVAESVLTAWVYNHSGGSVLIAAIFHALTDGALVFAGALTHGMPLFWLAVAVAVVAASLVALADRSLGLSTHSATAEPERTASAVTTAVAS